MRYITVLIVVVAAVAFVKGQSDKEKLEMIMRGTAEECEKTMNFSGVVDKFYAGEFSSISAEQKCVAKCMFERMGLCDGSGEPNMEAMEKLVAMDPPNRDKYMACMEIDGPADCEKAFTVLQCTLAVCQGSK